MHSARKLLIEAFIIPLVYWVLIWVLFYLYPSPDLPRKNYSVGWLITATVSLIFTLLFTLWYVRRHLKKVGLSTAGPGEPPRQEDDPSILAGPVRIIFTAVLLWGSFCTAVLLKGLKGGRNPDD